MAKTPVSNFRIRPKVKTHLMASARIMQIDMTTMIEDLIEDTFARVSAKFPDQVKAVIAELEQNQNGAIR